MTLTKRWFTGLMALALVATACAERGPDPSYAVEVGPAGDSSSAPATPTPTASDGATTGEPEPDPATQSPPAPVMWGTLESPCGPGDATGDTDIGVSDDTIQIGTIADPGFTGSPGMNQEVFDAAETFAAWCNAQGGILGRELKVQLRDAALFDNLARVQEACESDFALVGGGSAFDDQGAQARVDCALPDVAGFAVTAEAVEADLIWPAMPNGTYSFPVGHFRYLAEENPDVTQAVGMMFPNFGATIVQKDRTIEALGQIGFNVVYEGPFLATGEANWTPFVIAMREAGVELFTFVGATDQLAGIQQAMAEQDWFPEVMMVDASFYDAAFAQANEAAEGMLVRVVIVPFEEAATNPGTQLYLDELAATVGADPATLGVQGMSAHLLFATAAKACGSELTRVCLGEQLDQVTEWTGGGMHSPSTPSETTAPECVILLEIVDGGYERVHPAEPGTFSCGPENVVALEGDYGQGATVGG